MVFALASPRTSGAETRSLPITPESFAQKWTQQVQWTGSELLLNTQQTNADLIRFIQEVSKDLDLPGLEQRLQTSRLALELLDLAELVDETQQRLTPWLTRLMRSEQRRLAEEFEARDQVRSRLKDELLEGRANTLVEAWRNVNQTQSIPFYNDNPKKDAAYEAVFGPLMNRWSKHVFLDAANVKIGFSWNQYKIERAEKFEPHLKLSHLGDIWLGVAQYFGEIKRYEEARLVLERYFLNYALVEAGSRLSSNELNEIEEKLDHEGLAEEFAHHYEKHRKDIEENAHYAGTSITKEDFVSDLLNFERQRLQAHFAFRKIDREDPHFSNILTLTQFQKAYDLYAWLFDPFDRPMEWTQASKDRFTQQVGEIFLFILPAGRAAGWAGRLATRGMSGSWRAFLVRKFGYHALASSAWRWKIARAIVPGSVFVGAAGPTFHTAYAALHTPFVGMKAWDDYWKGLRSATLMFGAISVGRFAYYGVLQKFMQRGLIAPNGITPHHTQLAMADDILPKMKSKSIFLGELLTESFSFAGVTQLELMLSGDPQQRKVLENWANALLLVVELRIASATMQGGASSTSIRDRLRLVRPRSRSDRPSAQAQRQQMAQAAGAEGDYIPMELPNTRAPRPGMDVMEARQSGTEGSVRPNRANGLRTKKSPAQPNVPTSSSTTEAPRQRSEIPEKSSEPKQNPAQIKAETPPQKISDRGLQETLGRGGFKPSEQVAVLGRDANGDIQWKEVPKENPTELRAAQDGLRKGGYEQQHLGRIYKNQFGRSVVFVPDLPIKGVSTPALFLGQGFSSTGFLVREGEVYLFSKTIGQIDGGLLHLGKYKSSAAKTDIINSIMPDLFPDFSLATSDHAIVKSRGLGPSLESILEHGRGEELPNGSLGRVLSEHTQMLQAGLAFLDTVEGSVVLTGNTFRWIDVGNSSINPSPDVPVAKHLERAIEKRNLSNQEIQSSVISGNWRTDAAHHWSMARFFVEMAVRSEIGIEKFVGPEHPYGTNPFMKTLLKNRTDSRQDVPTHERTIEWFNQGLRDLEHRMRNEYKNSNDDLDVQLEDARVMFFEFFLMENTRMYNFQSQLRDFETNPGNVLNRSLPRMVDVLDVLAKQAGENAPQVVRNQLVEWAIHSARSGQQDNYGQVGRIEVPDTKQVDYQYDMYDQNQ